MKVRTLLTSGVALCLVASAALANDDLVTQMENPAQWAIQTGDYKNQRYSALDKINKENVGDLQVAWTWAFFVVTKARRW
ncbi:hypothetical protein C8D95_109181 [Silicimonas algicola]|uniref:Pyrrolo-quinoline quinone repeat domain-containing protein n=1 Tax=Silicimonas algicola TaxID=1826607 RepID=A0A316G397_9RHOB|nr:hypothetical protein C8D95_109181 [Silicimonas algicola]